MLGMRKTTGNSTAKNGKFKHYNKNVRIGIRHVICFWRTVSSLKKIHRQITRVGFESTTFALLEPMSYHLSWEKQDRWQVCTWYWHSPWQNCCKTHASWRFSPWARFVAACEQRAMLRLPVRLGSRDRSHSGENDKDCGRSTTSAPTESAHSVNKRVIQDSIQVKSNSHLFP